MFFILLMSKFYIIQCILNYIVIYNRIEIIVSKTIFVLICVSNLNLYSWTMMKYDKITQAKIKISQNRRNPRPVLATMYLVISSIHHMYIVYDRIINYGRYCYNDI